MAINDDNDDYAIGYGHPPKHTQFQKGTSGNKKGRPKGSKNVATALHDELNERVFVTVNGKRGTITKREAILKQVVNKAAGGDTRSTQILLNLSRELGDLAVPDVRRPINIVMRLNRPTDGEDPSCRYGPAGRDKKDD